MVINHLTYLFLIHFFIHSHTHTWIIKGIKVLEHFSPRWIKLAKNWFVLFPNGYWGNVLFQELFNTQMWRFFFFFWNEKNKSFFFRVQSLKTFRNVVADSSSIYHWKDVKVLGISLFEHLHSTAIILNT